MSDRDTITLPREVVEKALEALGEETAWFGPTPKGAAAITALRTALAAEQPKQEPVAKAWAEGYQQGVKDERTSEASIGIAGFGAKVEPARQNPYGTALAAEPTKPSDSLKAMKEAFRILTKPESGYLRWQVSDACDILRTAIRTAQSALAAEKRHPDYVIGNHWFETAYERLCAGEAEDAILEDYELVREPRLRDLRRDAERYRWLRDQTTHDGCVIAMKNKHIDDEIGYAENIDRFIDAAMEASTAPASAAADSSTAPEDRP